MYVGYVTLLFNVQERKQAKFIRLEYEGILTLFFLLLKYVWYVAEKGYDEMWISDINKIFYSIPFVKIKGLSYSLSKKKFQLSY